MSITMIGETKQKHDYISKTGGGGGGWAISSAVYRYRITEHWYGESYTRVWENPRKREIPTEKREIPIGKLKKQYIAQVICDSIYELGEYYVSREY